MSATEGFMKAQIEHLEEENKNLKSDLEQFSEAYKRYRDYEKEELAESCYDLERENKKLQEKVTTFSEEYGKLREEKQKLKDRIAKLEKCNLNLQEQIDKITADRDERKRKEECSNVIIDFVKQQAREKSWEL